MQRKLRTIVEAIRVFNLKQAWKLANGMDQKKPGWKALEVLKAAILDKWGRADEADEMIQRLFTDDNDWQEETFESLQFFYGERRDWSSLADVYQHLWTQHMNIPLGENCVFNYIRGKNYSEAQKVANKLFRLDSSRKHYMAWWILCLVLQVRYQKADSRILILAAKLGNKYIAENSFVPPSFIRLYIILLEQLQDYESAKQLLRQYLQVSNVSLKKDYEEWLAKICYQNGEYEEAIYHYEQLIIQRMENYHYWYMWMKCQWSRKETSGTKLFVQRLLEQTKQLYSQAISSVENMQKNPKTLRTLYLIQMEICRYLLEQVEEDWISSQLYAIIQQYLSDMSSLSCCSTDLRVYVSLLEPKEKSQLCAEYLFPCTTFTCCSKEAIFTTVEYLWLLLFVQPLSLPSMDTLLEHYIDWSRANLVPFEHQYADGIILLIVNQLLSNDSHICSPCCLVEAIQVLQIGKQYSPYALEFRLFLVILYAYLGCFESAVEEWNALELKHIQLFTLSFLLGPFVHRWYDIPWMRWYHKTLSLFEKEHMEETPQGIFLAIRQQSYETALDIVQFQYKVEHSETFLAWHIYSCHQSLFYHHRNAIRSVQGFSSDWLRHVRIAYTSLIRQWNEQTCEDLYIVDDRSVWNKNLGTINASSWLESDEMRIFRVRLDYINLRLLLSLLLGEFKCLPNWTNTFFQSAIDSIPKNNAYYSVVVEYWYCFWQLIDGLLGNQCKEKTISNTHDSMDNVYQRWYSHWLQCVPWNNQEKETRKNTLEYFPIEYPKWVYYVHQIGLYGILSVAYLMDNNRQLLCCNHHLSLLKNWITTLQPVVVAFEKTWCNALRVEIQHPNLTISMDRLANGVYDQYRSLGKTYLDKVQQLQQDIQYLWKLHKTI